MFVMISGWRWVEAWDRIRYSGMILILQSFLAVRNSLISSLVHPSQSLSHVEASAGLVNRTYSSTRRLPFLPSWFLYPQSASLSHAVSSAEFFHGQAIAHLPGLLRTGFKSGMLPQFSSIEQLVCQCRIIEGKGRIGYRGMQCAHTYPSTHFLHLWSTCYVPHG